uniref:hypothetical protein n=1 Tax=Aquabacterium parvum TaxID=70584 RepID=UPI001F1E012F
AGVGLHGLPNLQESAGPVFVSLQISHHTSTKIALQINGLRVVQDGQGSLGGRAIFDAVSLQLQRKRSLNPTLATKAVL